MAFAGGTGDTGGAARAARATDAVAVGQTVADAGSVSAAAACVDAAQLPDEPALVLAGPSLLTLLLRSLPVEPALVDLVLGMDSRRRAIGVHAPRISTVELVVTVLLLF